MIMLKYLMAIRHILLRLADFVVIRTLQCWNLRRIICSSCLNLTTRRCVRVSKLSTTWGKVKSIFVFWKPLFKEIYFSFLRYHFFTFLFHAKKLWFWSSLYVSLYTIATYWLTIIRHISLCSSTLKIWAVDEWADIEEMKTTQRHGIYIFCKS